MAEEMEVWRELVRKFYGNTKLCENSKFKTA